MRRFIAHRHEQEYIDAAIRLFTNEIPGQASFNLPRFVPGNSALLQQGHDPFGDTFIRLNIHAISPVVCDFEKNPVNPL
jgi:hypothetical protein